MAISKKIVNGKVVYDVFVKGRDNTGKQIGLRRRSIPNEREAKRIEFELKTELNLTSSKMNWKKWSDHFLERYRVEYTNSTYTNYKVTLEKWVNPIWKDRFIEDITPSDVHQMVFEHIKCVSSYSRRTFLKIIRRAFSMAVEDGIIARNPSLGIKVKICDANQTVLNKNEIDILLREAKSVEHRFYHHWAFAILTGMRSGEMHALRWTDVDFVTGFVTVSKSWTRLNGLGPTKTAKNRVCPISKECRKFLQELKMLTGNTDFVLPRLWEWDQGNQGQIIKDFCRGIGITPVKFHDLRATFITQMLSNGVPLAKVMSIVGHASLKTTQGYLRLCGKDVEGATEELNVTLPAETRGGNVVEFRKS
jgi:integrase